MLYTWAETEMKMRISAAKVAASFPFKDMLANTGLTLLTKTAKQAARDAAAERIKLNHDLQVEVNAAIMSRERPGPDRCNHRATLTGTAFKFT